MSSTPAPADTAPPTLRTALADDLPELSEEWQADDVPDRRLVALNEPLAHTLGIGPEWLRTADGLAFLTGQNLPTGARPVALAYAGHQFGGYSPRLGDGRALLLGERETADGALVDIHLKGSGRTPFARGGDGKATIGPMLREHLISEAMAALGVPTTRSLAVLTTGEEVARRTMEPGALLVRVAASHLRVGTFEYAARLGGPDLVDRLVVHAAERHHAGALATGDPHAALLAAVVEAQAELVARWMLLGFVHGVMNTDNMTISGQGIDYGPCAFVDRYEPGAVFSSIDHGGRYAFGNQPTIATWNLARLAETLLAGFAQPAEEAAEHATEIVRGFDDRLDHHWRSGMCAKVGLIDNPADESLLEDLWRAMHEDERDITSTFRLLSDVRRGTAGPVEGALVAWVERWDRAVQREGRGAAEVAAGMDALNPVVIPRNHLVEEALDAANTGDLEPFESLLARVTDPYTSSGASDRYAEPAPAEFTATYRTYCGT